MRKTLLAVVSGAAIGLLWAAAAFAQQSVIARPTPYAAPGKPVYCQITNLAAATKLLTANCSTGSILTTAKIAQICVSVSAVRYTSDPAVTPTATIGMPAATGCFPYSGPITTVQFIQQAAGSIIDIETFP